MAFAPVKKAIVLGLAVTLTWFTSGQATAGVFELFTTEFESSQGYDAQKALAGQNGWLGFNAGEFDNGLISGFIPGAGQHAYLGFAPSSTNLLLIWQPLDYTPASNQLVNFTVTQVIVDSTNGYYDDFEWTVYNRAGDPLFTLDFDNDNHHIYYVVDGQASYTDTGFTFSNSIPYQVSIEMSFASNWWRATLNGTPITQNLPMTTTGKARDLGDIDAGWAIRDPLNSGDNFLVFDNYRVTVVTPDPPPPVVQALAKPPNGPFRLRLTGSAGGRYVIEASQNLLSWTPVFSNSVPAATFEFSDPQSTALPARFYRARVAP